MQNQNANLRPKTSASLYDTAGVQPFFSIKISSGQHWFSSVNWAHIVKIMSKWKALEQLLQRYWKFSRCFITIIHGHHLWIEARQTTGWFSGDIISRACKCSDCTTETWPRPLIGQSYSICSPLCICPTILFSTRVPTILFFTIVIFWTRFCSPPFYLFHYPILYTCFVLLLYSPHYICPTILFSTFVFIPLFYSLHLHCPTVLFYTCIC